MLKNYVVLRLGIESKCGTDLPNPHYYCYILYWGTGLNMVGSWLEKVAGLKTVSDLAVSVLEIDKELFSQ
jgi:hypothetical protein